MGMPWEMATAAAGVRLALLPGDSPFCCRWRGGSWIGAGERKPIGLIHLGIEAVAIGCRCTASHFVELLLGEVSVAGEQGANPNRRGSPAGLRHVRYICATNWQPIVSPGGSQEPASKAAASSA